MNSLDVRRLAAAAAARGKKRSWATRAMLRLLGRLVSLRGRLERFTARHRQSVPNAAPDGAVDAQTAQSAAMREGAGVAPSGVRPKTPAAGA